MNKNNIEDIYQLSPMQQGMLFHTFSAPESGMYYQQFSCTFTGKLDVQAFDRAWQQVIARHVILRTAFSWERQDPLQVVYRQVKLPIAMHSWVGISPNKQQQQLEAFFESDRALGFQVSKAPLMRLTLIQLSDDVYRFIWSYHHVLIDGWSIPLVFKEVLGFYEALSHGQDLHLPPSSSYREYITWLQKQNLAQAEEFWRQTLKGLTAPTPLVVDKANQSSSSSVHNHSEHFLELSQTTTTALVSLARKNQITLNTLVQAAWALLLSRYSGETNVLFGVTVSGRPAAISGVESIIGLFINTLPMQVRICADDSIIPLLKQIQKQQFEISQYEYSPLVQVHGWSELPRGLPLFDSIVVFENYPVDATLQQQNLNVQITDFLTYGKTNYPLTVVVVPGTQLSVQFIYDEQRFEAASIQKMAEHLQNILQAIAANPDQKISQIPLLSAAEQHQILREWNDTTADYPKQLCIHSWFEQQVVLTPDAVAVEFKDKRLTYKELNALANQLAHYLQRLGVEPEVLVGLGLESSLSMVVGLLGILKAGGAYVPLDLRLPQERLTFMLEDAQVLVLLTDSRLVEKFVNQQAQIVCLDTDWNTIAKESEENPVSGVTSKNLAYIIYTSGSTGKPKGTLIVHQGVINYLSWCIKSFAVTDGCGAPVNSSIAFDATITSLFSPLLVGKKIVLLPEEEQIEALASTLRSGSHFSLVKITPAHLDILSQLLPAQEVQGQTRALIIGGEALSGNNLSFWRNNAPDTRVINEYGPTETVVGCCVYEVTAETSLSDWIPIGRPIANTQLYILDQNWQPVPIGVTGELYIGGDGLARGYLNARELTASKFIPNPFSNQPGERLYKTGDLARYLSDGNIDYLGRTDNQVKIRGFRIELGEIEAVVSQHPQVRQTVVIVTKDVSGNKRLAAYIVPYQDAPTVSDLRQFLQQKLPEYMVPSSFTILEVMPLTSNGKVDRKALPDPESAERETTFVAPRTPTEEVLAGIWSHVLGLEQVSIYDNFFDLGGHSLTATQLIFRLQNTFKIKLSLQILLETPTVAGMAQAIDNPPQETPIPTIAVTELNAEAVLDSTICPISMPFEHIAEPERIFITGATGFLGAFLLYELLQQTKADIYYLIRSSDEKEARNKLEASLKSYLLWNECLSSRIIPVIGDLSQPLFGLSDQQFQTLAGSIDVIYHNGALVNFVDPYHKLKAANVLGTQEVLRLATQIKTKPVHYISTTSVFHSDGVGVSKVQVFREDDTLDHGSVVGGYAQSKWVAEKLVTIARSRGIPVNIYRPGRISGDSQSGASNTDDLIARMLKGCIQLGSIPNLDIMVEMVPVDYTSKSIVHISRQQKSLGETFHIVNPSPAHWSNIVTWLRSFGYSLEQVTYKKWQADLLNSMKQSSSNALYPLIRLFGEEVSEDANEATGQTSNSENVQFDCQNTLNGLAGTSINCPPVSAELLSKYISYYTRIGFVKPLQQTDKDSLNQTPSAIIMK